MVESIAVLFPEHFLRGVAMTTTPILLRNFKKKPAVFLCVCFSAVIAVSKTTQEPSFLNDGTWIDKFEFLIDSITFVFCLFLQRFLQKCRKIKKQKDISYQKNKWIAWLQSRRNNKSQATRFFVDCLIEMAMIFPYSPDQQLSTKGVICWCIVVSLAASILTVPLLSMDDFLFRRSSWLTGLIFFIFYFSLSTISVFIMERLKIHEKKRQKR